MEPNYESWFRLSGPKQMLNIGGEVYRALEWQKQNEFEKSRHFSDKALRYLEISKKDPKNKSRIHELIICEEALTDYFQTDSITKTSAKSLTDYFDSFIGFM